MKPSSPRSRRSNELPPSLGHVPVGRIPMGHIPMGHIPMEWMDPMSWRLPSGKALAEFALQAGFLAPLILHGPRVKTRSRVVPAGPLPVTAVKESDEKNANGAQAGGLPGARL